jgi:murein L,D-transpeptidase YafK
VECVKPSPKQAHFKYKRAILAAALGMGVALCVGHDGNAQSGRVRIQTTATGQAAIGRVRGRLQIAYDELGLRYGAPVYLRLIKEQKRLEVWVQGPRQEFVRLRSYRVCGTSSELGPRVTARTPRQPEGFYTISATGLRPPNITYLGLDLNWPNAYDQAQGWRGATSLVQAGCAGEPHFGLTDQDMEEVYALVHSALANGQASVSFHIFPFAMSRLRMMAAGGSPNAPFWQGLAPAWQAFENTKKPPQVRVLGRRYVVTES